MTDVSVEGRRGAGRRTSDSPRPPSASPPTPEELAAQSDPEWSGQGTHRRPFPLRGFGEQEVLLSYAVEALLADGIGTAIAPRGATEQRSRLQGRIHHELGSDRGKLEAAHRQGEGEWGKLTDDDLTAIAGKRDQLAGKLREHYGYEEEEQAETELDAFMKTLKS